MKRPNFIHWYYNEGIHGLLEIWKNFLLFAWQHFSIFELLKTLLSPWRRDVATSNWVGLHPIKMLSMVFENILSSLLGAVVRMFVISAGLIVFMLVLILGLVINVIWIGTPLLLVAAFISAFISAINPYYLVGMSLIWVGAIITFYYQDTRTPMLSIGVKEL